MLEDLKWHSLERRAIRKCVLIIEGQVLSPYEYEEKLPFAVIVAKSIRNGLQLLKYSNKIIDAILISDESFNPVGLIAYIQKTYSSLPLFLMTENTNYIKFYNQSKQINIILPPFDIDSIRRGLEVFINKNEIKKKIYR